MTTPATGVWAYRDTTLVQGDLTGYNVEATDGKIGKIDKASNEVGNSFVVVDTGPWILGKKVMIPAGVVRDVDPDTETVYVDRTKEEIKNAPEFDDEMIDDTSYRRNLSGYYGDK